MDTGQWASIRLVIEPERRIHLGKIVVGKELLGWTVSLIDNVDMQARSGPLGEGEGTFFFFLSDSHYVSFLAPPLYLSLKITTIINL